MQKRPLALVGTAVIVLGNPVMSAEPASAAEITFDTKAEIAGEFAISALFASVVENEFDVSLPSGPFPFFAEFSETFTIDDDPAQYLDGDISLGWKSFLSKNLWFGLDAVDPSLLDALFDLEFDGKGTLTNGIENLDFILSYDSSNNEFISTFSGFDPDNNFIDSCLIDTCAATANFDFSLFLAQTLYLEPLKVASASGSFSITTTPVYPSQPVPEPTTLLGLLGVSGLMVSQRRKADNA